MNKEKISNEDIFQATNITEKLLCDTVKMLDETIKKQSKLVLFLIMIIFLSNAIWIGYISQYEVVNSTYTQDVNQGGNANFIGNDGDISNGKTSDNN